VGLWWKYPAGMELDASVLSSVVERALGATGPKLTGWSAEPIFAGDGQGLGVFRVTGRARVADETRAWSVILKVLPAVAPGLASAWSHPVREALAYETGLLDALPAGLDAPRCLGHSEHSGRHHLWLEDLGPDETVWTVSDYGHAARRLGCFNGAYLAGRSLPAEGWLSDDWLRSWLAEGAAAVEELLRYRNHPLVRRTYPPDVLDQLVQLWTRRYTLLDALDRLPRVLCHHDAFRRNLFLQSGRLVAVDWAFLGPGPLGAELGPLVTASAAFLAVERERWDDLEETVGNGYLQGLRDAGWNGPPALPRFGFAASSALRYGPGVVRLVLPTLLDETAHAHTEALLGIPFDTIVDLWADVNAKQMQLADEAFTLLPTLG
jgi:Phosphotransferase enzyme family